MKRMNRQSGFTIIESLGLIFLFFVAIFGLVFVLNIIIGPPFGVSDPTVINTPTNAMVTKGNNSWIPLDLDGTPARYSSEILAVMEVFEKTNPDLEVISWTVEKRQRAYTIDPHVYGIWVHHRKQVR